MQIRMLQPGEEMKLARMKWLHCQEDDRGYGEHNLDGADYATFAAEFTAFLRAHPEYRVYVAAQGDTLAAAMFVYVIPKVPKPGGHAQSIAYLTNVYTLPEWRNQGVGTRLLQAGAGRAAVRIAVCLAQRTFGALVCAQRLPRRK
mgnify:CR=1 FL=1